MAKIFENAKLYHWNAIILQWITIDIWFLTICVLMQIFCNRQHNHFVYLWLFLAIVELSELLQKQYKLFAFVRKIFVQKLKKVVVSNTIILYIYEFFLHLYDFSNYCNHFAIAYKNIFSIAILLQKYAKKYFLNAI